MNRQSCSRKLRSAVLLAILAPVAGCGRTDRTVSTTIPMDDYRNRHAIALAESRNAIDVFPSLGQNRLDEHTAKQIYAFAAQYRDIGQGSILVLMPRGRSNGAQHGLIADIKRVLALGGVGSGVIVSSYPVADPALASPVRLSFQGLKATVADQCGQWPMDLSTGSGFQEWDNKPYWNLGCATQSMVAAQTSDPRDLVTPRGEEPADTQIREKAISKVRAGTDPNTQWIVKNSNIGGVGSN